MREDDLPASGGPLEIIFLLAGVGFVVFGLLVLSSELRTRRGAVEVDGELAGFAERAGNSGGVSFRPIARFTGADGVARYVEGSVGSSSPLGAVGDPVTVLVDRLDPGKAAIKSRLTFVGGGVLASMGVASCAVFFSVFRISAFSIVGAIAVLGVMAWKLFGMRRKTPISMQEWKDYKKRILETKVFTEEEKARIPWAHRDKLDAARRQQLRTNRVAAPALLVAGAGLLLFGSHLHRKTTGFLANAVSAPGVVVGLEMSESGEDSTWAPVVEFEHQGSTYRFKDSVGSNPASYRRGDAARVLYDPTRPSNARIDRGPWNRIVPLAIAGSGALLCVASLFVAAAARRASTT